MLVRSDPNRCSLRHVRCRILTGADAPAWPPRGYPTWSIDLSNDIRVAYELQEAHRQAMRRGEMLVLIGNVNLQAETMDPIRAEPSHQYPINNRIN